MPLGGPGPTAPLQTRGAPASTRDAPFLYTAIFFTFAPIGCVMAMGARPPGTWVFTLVASALSGAIAVAWASCFIRRKFWWLAAVVPLQVAVPWAVFAALYRSGVLEIGSGVGNVGRLTLSAALAIGMLALGFVMMVRHVRRVESLRSRAEAELDVAKRVHETIVPDLSVSTPTAEIFGQSHASSEMGGDLIDVIVRGATDAGGAGDLDEIDVYLADVSGHGVGAGIVMAMVKSAIRTRLRQASTLPDVLTDVNAVLAELAKPGTFATLACVRLRPGGRLEYALAGHLPILLWRAGQNAVVDLSNEHLPLGVDRNERFASGHAELHRGDTLLLFTDGLIETQDANGRQLGLASLRSAFAARASDSLPALHDALMAMARGHGRQADDQTLLLVRAIA